MRARESAQPIVLCDIDKTMVITPHITERALRSLAPEIPIEQALLFRDRYLQTLGPGGSKFFHPVRFIEFICMQLGTDLTTKSGWSWRRQLLARYLHKEHFVNAVYPEVRIVLEDLSRLCVLGTFSEGVYQWQYYKLYCTQLLNFFEDSPHRLILPNKRLSQAIALLPSQAFVVEDNPHVIAALVAAQSTGQQFTPVWINRENQVLPQELQQVRTITSFEELPELVKSMG